MRMKKKYKAVAGKTLKQKFWFSSVNKMVDPLINIDLFNL